MCGVSIILNGVRYDAIHADLSNGCASICDLCTECDKLEFHLSNICMERGLVFKKSDESLSMETNNGWTEITLDNVNEIYLGNLELLMVAFELHGRIVYRFYNDISYTLSQLSRFGGYYYRFLPELKIK